MNINSNKILKLIYPFGALIFAAYFINTVLFFYLPKTTVEYTNVNVPTINFTRYDMAKPFGLIKAKKPKKAPVKVVKKEEYQLLSNLILKAVYAKTNNEGWIIIQEKANSKTQMLEKGELFKAYKLIKVFKKYVIFEKNSKEYKLSMPGQKEEEKLKYEVITKKEEKTNDWKEKISIDGDTVKVTRKYLNSYVNDI